MRIRGASTAVCLRQPLDLTSEPAPSPTGRPYSPYPYRDLAPAPREWERHAQPSPTPAPEIHHDRFSLFPLLPIELRLQVWRQAILSAAEHGRVHRIRLAVSKPLDHEQSRLELVVTPRLADSTRATRSLLSTCAESRRESLSHPLSTLPDALPLQHGGLLRCNLSKDIILLEDLSSPILVQLSHLHLPCHDDSPSHPPLHPLSNARHLGLDLAPCLAQTPTWASYPPVAAAPGIPGDVESALVTFAASLPRLEQIYLLQAPAGVPSPLSPPGTRAPTSSCSPEHLFFSAQPDSAETAAVVATAAGEWYATRPPPSFFVDVDVAAGAGRGVYYAHLTRLVRFLCRLRQALDTPVVEADDIVDEAGLLLLLSFERLAGVRVRLLGHYMSGSRAEGMVGEKRRGREWEGEWEESSPERCLEVALEGEPRWVQWEWVCQCLGC